MFSGDVHKTQDLYSISSKRSYYQSSLTFGAEKLDVVMIDRHLDSAAVEVPVKFRSDWKSINPTLVAPKIYENLR